MGARLRPSVGLLSRRLLVSSGPKGGDMKIRARYLGLGALLALVAALVLLAALPSAATGGKAGKHAAKSAASHVRWDIISTTAGRPPRPGAALGRRRAGLTAPMRSRRSSPGSSPTSRPRSASSTTSMRA